MFNEIPSAREFLQKAGVFYDADPDEPDMGDGTPTSENLNLNDAFFWACSDCEHVPDIAVVEVANLFWRYGWCGILYWVCNRRDMKRVEFKDINRFIDFVRHEEAVRKELPGSSQRAYRNVVYTLGEEPPK